VQPMERGGDVAAAAACVGRWRRRQGWAWHRPYRSPASVRCKVGSIFFRARMPAQVQGAPIGREGARHGSTYRGRSRAGDASRRPTRWRRGRWPRPCRRRRTKRKQRDGNERGTAATLQDLTGCRLGVAVAPVSVPKRQAHSHCSAAVGETNVAPRRGDGREGGRGYEGLGVAVLRQRRCATQPIGQRRLGPHLRACSGSFVPMRLRPPSAW
jgi:hypothetical protein